MLYVIAIVMQLGFVTCCQSSVLRKLVFTIIDLNNECNYSKSELSL